MRNTNRNIDDFKKQTKDSTLPAKATSVKEEDQYDEEELDRQIEQFIKGELEKDTLDYTDEEETTEDFLFPDGEIEQNNNISVKVEILRPIPNPREELDKLVGCTDIKHRMDELVALTSYNKMMHEEFLMSSSTRCRCIVFFSVVRERARPRYARFSAPYYARQEHCRKGMW